MKHRSIWILTVLIFLMQGAVHLPAQSIKLMADIPFGFVAGGLTFPAGQYSVESLPPHIVRVRSSDSRLSAAFLTIGVSARDPQARARLVFNRYGETYFLSQIWSPGYSTGREVPKSRLEDRLAQSEPTPQRREIALRRSR